MDILLQSSEIQSLLRIDDMKKMLSFTLAFVLILAVLPCQTHAAETDDAGIIYLDNGDYITIEISSATTRTTASKSKTFKYHNSSGEEEWRAVLSGTFTYNGTTATCTASSCDVSVTNTSWSVESKTVGRTGGSATANLTMCKKLLGFITTSRETLNMTLTCSPDGTFS